VVIVALRGYALQFLRFGLTYPSGVYYAVTSRGVNPDTGRVQTKENST
jgi:hypothetical protein